MKLKLKQEKLRDLLEKLSMQGMFGDSVITTKDDHLESIQKEANAVGIRKATFEKAFFDEYESDDNSILIDVERALNVVKKMAVNTDVTVETKEDKIRISNKKVSAFISYNEAKDKVMKSMPFELNDDGVPEIKGVVLDTQIKMKIVDLKDAVDYGSSLNTEFYTFRAKDDSLQIRVGDLHKFSDYIVFKPEADVKKEAEAIYTIGIPQISKTFIEEEFTINYTKDAPCLFIEESKDCKLEVLLPPQVKK